MADRPARQPTVKYSGRLHRLDSALAEDVDTLLEGSFETVSSVLSELAEAAGATPEPDEPESRGPAAPERPDPTRFDPPADPPEDTPAPAVRPAPRPASAAPPAPAAPRESAAPRRPAGAEGGDAPRRPVTPAFSIDPAPAPAPAEDWLAEAEASWSSPAWARGPDEARASEPAAVTALKIILAIANLPLRIVPARLRPAVDWLALSLAFWVPVVWLVVLLMTSGE